MYFNRSGENGNPPPRSSRIFNMENVWYFSTREGADIGPFNSQVEASNGLQDFLQFIQLANKQTLQIFLQTLSHKDRQGYYN
jgi:Domain of unknown function (DUF6316)